MCPFLFNGNKIKFEFGNVNPYEKGPAVTKIKSPTLVKEQF